MRLRSMLAVPTVVVVLVTCALVATLSMRALHDWRRGEEGRHLQLVLRQLLELQETLSLEPAPTNTALSATAPMQADVLAAVAAARDKTDARLRALASVPDLLQGAANSLVDLSSQLHTTCARADTLLRLLADARGTIATSALVDAMMRWSETISPAVEDVLEAAVAANSTRDSLLTAARAASDLRCCAGSISGWLTITLSRHELLSLEMVSHVRVLQGQVLSLHRELLANIRSADVQDQTRNALMFVEQEYFGSAQRLIGTVVSTEATTGDIDMTRVDFLRRYRPAMTSLMIHVRPARPGSFRAPSSFPSGGSPHPTPSTNDGCGGRFTLTCARRPMPKRDRLRNGIGRPAPRSPPRSRPPQRSTRAPGATPRGGN